MSKKAVIVPKYGWTVIRQYQRGRLYEIVECPTRETARGVAKYYCGKVRKVTKIVYYYE